MPDQPRQLEPEKAAAAAIPQTGTTADPAPPPEPQPEEPPRTPGDFNEAQLETIRKSEGIARAAKQPDAAPRLREEGMEADTPDALLAKATQWRALASQAVAATHTKEQHTGEGEDAGTALRREVEFYRNKARLHLNKHPEWSDTQEEAFKARYHINRNIFSSRALAEQAANDVFTHAAEDKLPGIKPTRFQDSATLLTRYIGTEETQSGAQSNATLLRTRRDEAYEEVLRLRREIQLTADATWPWHDDANLGRRREFLLPAGRAFVG